MKLEQTKKNIAKYLDTKQYILWPMLLTVTLIFTIVLYPNLISTRRTYQKGDIVDKDIKAPIDFFIEDSEATLENRKQAADAVLTVYDYDAELVRHQTERIAKAFLAPREVIRQHKKSLKLEKLTIENAKVEPEAKEPAVTGPMPGIPEGPLPPIPPAQEPSLETKLEKVKEKFQKEIGIPISDGAYQILKKDGFSQNTEKIIGSILKKILDNGVVGNKDILLIEESKGIALRTLGKDEEKTLFNLKKIYGLDQSKIMVRVIGQPILKGESYSTINMIVDLVQRLISPNIFPNRKETETRKQEAINAEKPVLYKIQAGEMILRDGEKVTESHLVKLREIEAQTMQENKYISGAGTAMIIILFLMVTYVLHFKEINGKRSRVHKDLLFLSSVLITFLLMAKLSAPLPYTFKGGLPVKFADITFMYGIPLAAGSMTVCLFLGLAVAVPFSLVLSVFTTIIFQNSFPTFIYFMLSSTMAAYWVQDCRERKVFIKAGAKIGLLNMAAAFAIDVYMSEITGQQLIMDWLFAFSGGMLTGIITAGLTPLVELVFGYTTDIKLLELSNLDQPILRRLMIEAPGSYNHSVIVGTMAEAAAADIKANPLLARVCGYYHDIGKIKKPLYFIENQMNGKNRHDKLAPSMSALILIGHIKDGVEMSKKYKLGQEITNTIRQHHGTSLISFFYDKAMKNKSDEESININDYRYPGPKPQTREAAIVMLADVVEAASRTLDNPTASRIQGLVSNLINKIFSDGQLNECDLTLKDLNIIAKCFNQLLTGIHHHRIKYSDSPALGTNGNGKNGQSKNGNGKNANTDREQPKQSKNSDGDGSGQGSGHLKRLGLS